MDLNEITMNLVGALLPGVTPLTHALGRCHTLGCTFSCPASAHCTHSRTSSHSVPCEGSCCCIMLYYGAVRLTHVLLRFLCFAGLTKCSPTCCDQTTK